MSKGTGSINWTQIFQSRCCDQLLRPGPLSQTTVLKRFGVLKNFFIIPTRGVARGGWGKSTPWLRP
uniref:Uncharacterized protein n=2 Tax=Meloidogyne TaxID=189290 RepID=A0A6V7U5E2_MELEN|nr:unnamed protein product [Meloidogyne enterolobii]